MRGVFAGIVDGAVRFFYDYDHELENEPFVNLVRAGADFIIGLYYGFPICCNLAYCRDTANDRSPGIRRDYEIREAGRKLNRELGYVPCLPCALTTDAQTDQSTQPVTGVMGCGRTDTDPIRSDTQETK